MLQELNRRLEGLSYCSLRMFQDSSGSVWLEDFGAGRGKDPVRIGTLADARGLVESLENEERMVAVMS
jgi:hypothetical protein